jgi:hypothetical protein
MRQPGLTVSPLTPFTTDLKVDAPALRVCFHEELNQSDHDSNNRSRGHPSPQSLAKKRID